MLDQKAYGKLSKEEQSKFDDGDINIWFGDDEEICAHFEVQDPDDAGNIYVRRFKALTNEEEQKWYSLSSNVLVLL